MLGPLTVLGANGWQQIRAAKQRTLLALLLIRANQAVAVEQLIDEMWPDDPPRTARNVLQGYTYQLRKQLGTDRLTWQGFGYRFGVEDGELDVHRFDELATAGYRAVSAGAVESARDTLAAALALWHGPALADVPAGPRIDAEVMRLSGLRRAALAARVDADLLLGRHVELVSELEDLVASSPLDEGLHRQLMIALYRSGRPADALDRYSRLRDCLHQELGIEPGEELRRLQARVLARDPALGLPADAPVAIAEPEVVVPSPAAMHTPPPPRPAQLPRDIPDFVGRTEASAPILAAMSAADTSHGPPIAVITGDPGVGKSTFAVHIAHRLREHYPDGQLYVDLSPPGAGRLSAAEVLAQLLGGLGVLPEAIPVAEAERAALFRSHLADRAVLVVLDNAADEEQIRPLLPGGRRCGVIVTSRLPLGGLGSQTSTLLHPLETGESLELLSHLIGAERIAAEPAQAVRLAGLCDGLPLALRICGARLAGRPGHGIGWLTDRLADERRRLDILALGDLGIRTSLDLSYTALDAGDRRAVRLLSLLDVPDFAPWLAAAVLDTTVTQAEDRLDRLVEVRLLGCAPGPDGYSIRYRFHQLLRIYAREQAMAQDSAVDRESAIDRAFGACLAIAEKLDQGLRRTVPKLEHSAARRWQVSDLGLDELRLDPLRWYDAERSVLVAAIRQAAATDRADLAWDLATSLDGYFDIRGWLDDWQRAHTAALSAVRRSGQLRGAASVLCSLGELGIRRDEFDPAMANLHESVVAYRRLGDSVGEAHALRLLSTAHRHVGSFDDAARTARRAVSLFRRTGPGLGIGEAWHGLGLVYRDRGRPAAALRCFTRALAEFERVDDTAGQARALSCRGTAAGLLGDLAEAERAQLRAVRLARRSGHRLLEALIRCRVGEHYVRIGRGHDALAHLEESLSLVRQMGDLSGEAMIRSALGEAHRQGGDQVAAAGQLAVALGLCRELGVPLLLARTLVRVGDTAEAAGDGDAAITVWREAAEVFERLGVPEAEPVIRRLAQRTPVATQ